MITYEKVSNLGTPVEPKVVRIRTDLSWEDVVVNYSLENPKQRALSGMKEKEKKGHDLTILQDSTTAFLRLRSY